MQKEVPALRRTSFLALRKRGPKEEGASGRSPGYLFLQLTDDLLRISPTADFGGVLCPVPSLQKREEFFGNHGSAFSLHHRVISASANGRGGGVNYVTVFRLRVMSTKLSKCQFRLEDVKKLIWWSFRDFSFETKCMPTSQRSLLGHPGAAFFRAQFSQQLKINSFTSSCQRNSK